MAKTPHTPDELTEMITGLNTMAHNLWWTWDQQAQEVFQELSPRGWQNMFHNAVAVLREVSDYELRVRLQDQDFADRVQVVLKKFNAYLTDKQTWGAECCPGLAKNPVAYFSAEFGFHETLPIAAGGLGVLAGDHTKSASDLGLGFVGISLFYREGYFQQAIDQNNWQTEFYSQLNPPNLPMDPVLDEQGKPVVCSVDINMSQVSFQVWRVNVGRVPIYLIDANRPENDQRFRDLTLRVYGGDSTTRIMQEILLGIGGVKLLRKLGLQPSVFHMNEGHAAFLTLELIREKMAAGQSFEQAAAATKQECIFTTHTPVEAGHDRFNAELMDYALHRYRNQLKVPMETVLGLGRVHPADRNEPFCMTVLALKHSRAANGVSELHGRVSRHMWQSLYPGKAVEEVPIGHITNGIHTLGWMKGSVRKFWRQRLAGNWEGFAPDEKKKSGSKTSFWSKSAKAHWDDTIDDPEFWKRIADPAYVSDEELWALRYQLRRELIEFSRRRLLLQGQSFRQGDFIIFDHLLNPDALTIGFARRFATYKRAPLIFQQFENIVRLCRDKSRPVQFIFAGKAHPRDDDGKRFIQHIIHLSKYSDLKGSLVFLENYDMHVARQMVSGCDVWLNNPRRPLEASGTSGMKAISHGCLNMSILDGWWREGYDGDNGFAIGDDSNPESIEEQDRIDAENVYNTLSKQVIPLFYDRDANGLPRNWIKRIRHSMVTLMPVFNTHRMVKEYAEKYYVSK
jgi:glycogen phosphorylase